MTKPSDERLKRFLETLRRPTAHGPGRGVKRLARFVRSGASLATSAFFSVGRGAETILTERDLHKIEGLVERLGELKGLPMKIGQIVSYLELELPAETRRLLSLLQTQAPATPFERVVEVIREDLGATSEKLLAGLDREPISIASIGQVHRGRLPDGTEVAVKVRHPDIEAAIRSDFSAANVGIGVAGAIPGMGATVRDMVGELEARLLEECDYRLEAERQQLFWSIYRDHPVIVVPQVQAAWCGPRVLTTTWQSGQGFEAFRCQASQQQRDAAGAALFDFYIGTLYRDGLFHADPHPGNYCFCDDGRVVVFDFGCVRVFEPDMARSFVALAKAVRADDRPQVVAALRGLGAEPSTNDAAYAHLRRLLRSFFKPMLTAGPHAIDGRIVIDMGQIARDKMAIARLRLPGRLMFLFRIRFGLYAVLSRLGAVCDWSALEQRLTREPIAS
ncbi:MAG: AarF/ABC1/UbiB kinase family protein [Deltaproteobacteria bacterium]|nr:AarF/ABC1/UbiB kinase family protein [Deltaproteobacteria bacterium]